MPGISIPIIDQLVHPSYGIVDKALVAGGVFTGAGNLYPPQNPLIALTYGIKVSYFTIPPELGLVVGNPNVYRDVICQLSAVYTLGTQLPGGGSGTEVITEMYQSQWDGGTWFWSEPFPTRIQYHVFPGCVVVFEWLQT